MDHTTYNLIAGEDWAAGAAASVTIADETSNAITATVNANPIITSNGAGTTAVVSVAENSTAVTTVLATDADAGHTVTYSISGGVDQAKFTINSTSGTLSFISAPNFELPTDVGANNTYVVDVTANDGHSGTDVQTITVSVTDLKATITSNGGGNSATVNLAENSTGVTTVRASAGEPGSTLSFNIAGGADAGQFSIDASTGALSFNAAPNFEAPGDSNANNTYEVIVQVSDGLGGVTSQSLSINISNANDAPAGAVTLSGTPTQGQTLTAANTLSDADGPSALTISYQWFANGAAISGATASTLTLDEAH
jgi:hypothetical protein